MVPRALFATLLLSALAAPAALAAPPDPFLGAWESVDAADGSNQTLHFGGGGATRRVGLHDDFASGCTAAPQGAVARGDGSLASATTIEVAFDVRCQKTGDRIEAVVTFTYDPVSNTLEDDLAPPTTWFRP
jgi:hypothetical protein